MMDNEPDINPTELAAILARLDIWSSRHPRVNTPFVFEMDLPARSYTPREFYQEVHDQTPFGRTFLQFITTQARRFQVSPVEFIDRAIAANEVRR